LPPAVKTLDRQDVCGLLDNLRLQALARSSANTNRKYALNRLGGIIALANKTLPAAVPIKLPAGVASAVQTYDDLLAACPGVVPPFPSVALEAVAVIEQLGRLITAAQNPAATLEHLASNALDDLTGIDDTIEKLIQAVKVVSHIGANPGTFQYPSAAGAVAKNVANTLTAIAAQLGVNLGINLSVNQALLFRCLKRLCDPQIGLPAGLP
jgi:hypothetical protein